MKLYSITYLWDKILLTDGTNWLLGYMRSCYCQNSGTAYSKQTYNNLPNNLPYPREALIEWTEWMNGCGWTPLLPWMDAYGLT